MPWNGTTQLTMFMAQIMNVILPQQTDASSTQEISRSISIITTTVSIVQLAIFL